MLNCSRLGWIILDYWSVYICVFMYVYLYVCICIIVCISIYIIERPASTEKVDFSKKNNQKQNHKKKKKKTTGRITRKKKKAGFPSVFFVLFCFLFLFCFLLFLLSSLSFSVCSGFILFLYFEYF